MFPSPPFKGVTKRVPPAREAASPIEEMVRSIFCPTRANAGSFAVTTTAATFLEVISD
jgi:hypothetical protein